MYQDKKIIAIIPARSGSKGLKDKNIKLLANKPLIAYTIKSAKTSGIFDKILVSTDSEKYAEISREYGACVPFLRSEKNSNDKAGSWDVVREVLSKLEEKYDIVILLQPTSPLRTAQNIKEAVDLFFDKNADTLFSICETPHSIFWCNTINENLSAHNFIKKEYQKPRQELPKSYMINGAIYIIKTSVLNNLDLYSQNSYVYPMSIEESIDIDSETDFLYAQTLIERRQNKAK